MLDAGRILNVIDSQIDKKIRSGALIEVTYGQVFEVTATGDASVYIAGSREMATSSGDTPQPSEGFRIPAQLFAGASDYVRVSLDDRGHRWIDEVFSPSTSTKVQVDVSGGRILFANTGPSDVSLSHGQYTGWLAVRPVGAGAEGVIQTFRSATDPEPTTIEGWVGGWGTSGIAFGIGGTTPTDTRLYRSAADTLKTDGSLEVGTVLKTAQGALTGDAVWVGNDGKLVDVNISNAIGIQGQQVPANGVLVFGSGKDTNLYRGAADTLKTDDTFIAANIAVGVVTITPVANTPTSVAVTGLAVSGTTLTCTTSANTTAAGSTVQETAYSSLSSTGVTVWIYRSSTTTTGVSYQIIGV